MSKNHNLKTIIPIVQTIADNKFVLGERLVEIGIAGPTVESKLTSMKMAQIKLSHARNLYNWSFLIEGLKKRPEVQQQIGKAFQQVVAVHDWVTLISSLLVVNIAVDLVMREIVKSDPKQTGNHLEKYLHEQKEHIIYSEDWAVYLLKDQGSIPEKLKEAVNSIQSEVCQWLTTIEKDQFLLENGFISKNPNLVDLLNKRVQGVLSKAVSTV